MRRPFRRPAEGEALVRQSDQPDYPGYDSRAVTGGREERLAGRDYIDDLELARRLSLTAAAVRNWRKQGRGPAYYKVESAVRYALSDVEAYMAGRKVMPTGRGETE